MTIAPTDVTITDGSTTKTYLIDRGGDYFKGYWHHDSIPFLRPQQDTSSTPTENSINPELGWLRSIESWHHGAGQTYYDRADSDRYRFRSSLGLDPWTKWQMSLLPDADNIHAMTTTFQQGPRMVVTNFAGLPSEVLYVSDYAVGSLYVCSDITAASPTFTAVTGFTNLVYDMCSDGQNTYVALGTTSVDIIVNGATTAAVYATYNVSEVPRCIGFIKGRLMLGTTLTGAGILYNITAPGALPTALFTHPTLNWNWLGFAEGPSCIYAAGTTGYAKFEGAPLGGQAGVSQVYRIGIKQDGTGLTSPVPASPGLPYGEELVSIANYLGFIVLGTSKGVRFCTADSNGDLTIGAPILTTRPVRCFAGRDRFIYFGMEMYDATHTGIGRMDLSAFISTEVPAYASDLMTAPASAGANRLDRIMGIATMQDRMLFLVQGKGLMRQSTSFVTSGQMQSGYITYNISDPKAPNKITANVKAVPATGSGLVELSDDDAAYTSILTIPGGSNAKVSAAISGTTTAERLELQTTLSSASDHLTGPTLTRETLLSEVLIPSGFFLNIPIMLVDSQVEHGGGAFSTAVQNERAQLVTWRTNRTPLTVNFGADETYTGIIRELKDTPDKQSDDALSFDSAMVIMFKTNS